MFNISNLTRSAITDRARASNDCFISSQRIPAWPGSSHKFSMFVRVGFEIE